MECPSVHSKMVSKSMEVHPQYRTEYGILNRWIGIDLPGDAVEVFHYGFFTMVLTQGIWNCTSNHTLGGFSSSAVDIAQAPFHHSLQLCSLDVRRLAEPQPKIGQGPWENGDLKSDNHPTKWWDIYIYVYIYTVHNGDIINNIPLGYQSRRAAGKSPELNRCF